MLFLCFSTLSDTITTDLDVKFSAADGSALIDDDLDNDLSPTILGKTILKAAKVVPQNIPIRSGQRESDPITVSAVHDLKPNGDPRIEGMEDFTVSVEPNSTNYLIVGYSSDSEKSENDAFASVDCEILDGVKAFVLGTSPTAEATNAFQNDVAQGSQGDCFLMAAMICLTRLNPAFLESNVVKTLVPGLEFQVNLFKNGDPTPIPYYFSGNILFRGADMSRITSTVDFDQQGVEIWPQLIEMAYATSLVGGWDELGNGGSPGDAWKALTNGTSDFWSIDKSTLNSDIVAKIQTFLAAGKQVVISTIGEKEGFDASLLPSGSTQPIGPNTRPLSGHHAYVVTGVTVDSSGDRWIELLNPWGYGDIRIKESILSLVSDGLFGLTM